MVMYNSPQYAPMAQSLRSMGRGEDTMLVHMTPGEVNSLQGLAMAAGGSLSTNPQTGLPEAGFLSRLLPTLIGGLGTLATGGAASPLLLAGLTGAGTAAITGDIGKGLMAGLGAFGGAGLANALGAGAGAAATTGVDVAGQQAAEQAAQQAAQQAVPSTMGGAVAQEAAQQAVPSAMATPPVPAPPPLQIAPPSPVLSPEQLSGQLKDTFGMTAPSADAPNFLQRYGRSLSGSLPEGTPSMLRGAAPYLGAYGVMAPLMEPSPFELPTDDIDYTVPRYRQREVMPRIPEGPAYDRDNYRGEMQYFTPSGFQRMAEGDEVPMPRDEIGGLGATAAAQLPEYVSMFQTSPGAVTGVPFGYGPGQSPSEQIRASMMQGGASTPAGGFSELPTTPPARSFDMGINPMSIDPTFYSSPLNKGERLRQLQGMGGMYNRGGTVNMESGGFVMPARETAEFGNGSTDAGQRRLASMGGMPIRGSGDGVSDSIPARIDGKQRAAVADGEVYFPPRVVSRMGGADKLRGMMKAAEKSRRKASRGGENKIRGLA
jgi:hypothetical protein